LRPSNNNRRSLPDNCGVFTRLMTTKIRNNIK
jgi:hypothetical protein